MGPKSRKDIRVKTERATELGRKIREEISGIKLTALRF